MPSSLNPFNDLSQILNGYLDRTTGRKVFVWFKVLSRPGLTRVKGIRFLLFEIIRVLVYILTIFKVTDFFVLYFLFKPYMPAKKYLRKKAEK